MGAGAGQDGEWHRSPHSSSPTPNRDQASDSRQVRNVDSEPPGTSARRLGLQSLGRASDIPVGCYRNSRVSSARLGSPEGGRTRHLPPPLWCCEWGFSFRMCTLAGVGELGGWVWHRYSKRSPEKAGLGYDLELQGNLGSIFVHRRLAPRGCRSFQASQKPCEHPLFQSSQVNPSLAHLSPLSNLGTSPRTPMLMAHKGAVCIHVLHINI